MAFQLVKYKSGIGNVGKVFWSLRQASSSRKLEEQITVSDDGSTIVCWHPEPRFPYECSRPLPPEQETHATLKIQSLNEVRSVFVEKKQEFVRQELMSLTYTTKHRWFPRSRDKYAKKTPPDREYL
jgi:large subunit ribosomal protein L42